MSISLTDVNNNNLEMMQGNIFKIILIGDSGTGKTSLLAKYLTGKNLDHPFTTLASEFATKIIQMSDGGYVKAQIWDTAGQEKYRSITYHHYQKCVGGLVVYDITQRNTYENVTAWINELLKLSDKNCLIALVGNKLDIVDKFPNKRQVPEEEAKSFAFLNHFLFFETSAIDKDVNVIFEQVIQNIYNERRKIFCQNEGNSLNYSNINEGGLFLANNNTNKVKRCYYTYNQEDYGCNCYSRVFLENRKNMI